jgi:hypothetical protein
MASVLWRIEVAISLKKRHNSCLTAVMSIYKCRAEYWIQMYWFSCKSRRCFPEPQQASTEDCGLWFRDCANYPFRSWWVNWERVLKSAQIKKWTKSLKRTPQISTYAKFEDVSNNNLQLISFWKLWNYWLNEFWGRASPKTKITVHFIVNIAIFESFFF